MLLASPDFLECLMVLFDPYTNHSAISLGAMSFHLTLLAIFHRELDFDDLIIIAIKCRGPTCILMPHWTGCHLSIPINGKTAGIKSSLLFGLPFMIGSCWCD